MLTWEILVLPKVKIGLYTVFAYVPVFCAESKTVTFFVLECIAGSGSPSLSPERKLVEDTIPCEKFLFFLWGVSYILYIQWHDG